MAPLNESFSEYDEIISAALGSFFEISIRSAKNIHPQYQLLWDQLARVTQNGGKRLRPKITILAYRAFGGTDIDAIVPVAAAQEILHTSLLIHDDIIDRELTRRGELNISGAYTQKFYSHVVDKYQQRHYSDSTALLGGDLLLAATFQLIDRCPLPQERLNPAKEILHEIIFEVAGGQLLDNEAAFLDEQIPAELIARYKTASYSFVGPLLIGAVLAGADEASMKQLKELASNLGVAFQLHDDLLGIFGDETQTGKSTSSDLREGKRTYIVEKFLEAAAKEDQALFLSLFGTSDLSDEDSMLLKTLLIQSGAKAKTESHIARYVTVAQEALSQLDISDEAKNNFELLMKLSTQRNT